MNWSTYKFRCSALGKIVSKSGKLTDTNKTYLNELFIGETYGTRKEISSKYFEKGLFEEESGITLLNKTLFIGKLLVKNKERKSNEYIHGECDCIKDGIVFDIKNAWDLFTFGKASLTWDYQWQLVGYMMLWDVDESALFYCLNNTPEHIIMDEEKRMFYSQRKWISFEDPEYLEACENLRKKHNYDSIPLEERFKVFRLKCTEDMKDELKESITKARLYLQELQNEHDARIQENIGLMTNGFLAHYESDVNATIIDKV